jgi:hypothetical protein
MFADLPCLAAASELLPNLIKKTFADGLAVLFRAQSQAAEISNVERAMRERLVALPAGGDKSRITARDSIVWRFPRARLKGTAPEDGLRVFQVAANEELLLVVRGGEMDDDHLAAETVKEMVAGVDDAAAGVEDEIVTGIFFEAGQNFVKRGNFFGQIASLVLGIGRTIGPSHPSGHTVDAGVTSGSQDGSEAFFNLAVGGDRRIASSGNALGPIGLAGTRHADQGNPQRLIRMRPHKESRIVSEAGCDGKRKRTHSCTPV